LLEDIICIRRNLYAPRSVAGADDFAKIAANLCGVGINGAADFDGLLFPH